MTVHKDDLLRQLAQTTLEEDTLFDDHRWLALCKDELPPEASEALRIETESTVEGRLAYEAFRPFDERFRNRVTRRIQGELTSALIERSLNGDEAALNELVELLTPVLQARVARILLRHGHHSAPRNLRDEVQDMTQEMFLLLFADHAKILRSWNPDRGLSLENFAGLVAERQVTSILRSSKRNPWREDPTLSDELDDRAPEPDPEESAASRDELHALLERLREDLTPEGWHLFDLIFLQELNVEQTSEETGKGPEAVYAWRSRLRRLARQRLAEIRQGSVSTR